jgi:hypothetical protein
MSNDNEIKVTYIEGKVPLELVINTLKAINAAILKDHPALEVPLADFIRYFNQHELDKLPEPQALSAGAFLISGVVAWLEQMVEHVVIVEGGDHAVN